MTPTMRLILAIGAMLLAHTAPALSQGSEGLCARNPNYMGCYPDADSRLSGTNTMPVAMGDTTARISLRNLSALLSPSQSILAYGGDPTGATDSSAAFNACTASVAAKGGVCSLAGGRFLLNPTSGVIVVPPNVSVECGIENPGPGNNVGTLYNSQAAILLPSSKTLQFQGASVLHGCLILRSGLILPVANSAGFAGTAVAVMGGDVRLSHTMILGFDQCVTGVSVDRFVADNLYLDCQNGFSLTNSRDSARLRGIHIWPYASVGYNAGNPGDAGIVRTGTGFALNGGNDDTYVDDLFVGYHQIGVGIGLDGTNTGNIGFGSVWIDDAATGHGTPSRCMTVSGQYDNIFITRLWNWTCAGLLVAGGPNSRLHINQYYASNTNGNGLDISGGTTFIDHADISVTKGDWAVSYNTIAATLDIGQLNLHDLSTLQQVAPIGLANGATIDKVRLRSVSNDGSKGNALYGGNQLGLFPLASNFTLTLPPTTLDKFNITGTAAIGSIQGNFGGREITLVFSGNTTVTNMASGGNLSLAGGTNFSATAGSILKLFCCSSSVNWIEEWRKP